MFATVNAFISSVYISVYRGPSKLSRTLERQPIQLQPNVKKDFDEIHIELRSTLHEPKLTQSACVGYLIRHYKENSQKQ